jgi:hypothetical protein
MEKDLQSKIWRYMDLAKFISLLSKQSLYFACATQFNDPYEGYFPKFWLPQNEINNLSNIKSKIDKFPFSRYLKKIPKFPDLENAVENMFIDSILSWGINSWHISEYESEAMWKLYSSLGQGIAIESTIERLKDSVLTEQKFDVQRVEYIDFEEAQEFNGTSSIFLKRKSFEHEKELRAIVLLKGNDRGQGVFVKCDLDILINTVHISPFAENYFKEVVENICEGKISKLNKIVIQSSLFDKPDYSLKSLRP